MLVGAGNPDGIYQAAKGSLWQDRVGGLLYQNLDGFTQWLPFSSGSDCYDWANPLPYPNAFLYEDFAGSYADYAAWTAGLAGRYASTSIAGAVSFDSTIQFNGRDSLKVTGDNGTNHANLFYTPPATTKLWSRSFVYFDPLITHSDGIFLGPVRADETGGAPTRFALDIVYVKDTWDPNLPGFMCQNLDDFTPDALGNAPWDDVKGRWVNVIILLETGITTPRFRLWYDGVNIIDSTRSLDRTGRVFDTLQLAFGKDEGTTTSMNYALVEYVDGEVYPDPYCLL
jgi:hypothetical protein